jgi:hypothetical protein
VAAPWPGSVYDLGDYSYKKGTTTDDRILSDRTDVKGRPNAASDGRLKSRHLKERICRLGFSAFELKESLDGESPEDGQDRYNSDVTRPRLVESADCA